MKKKIMRCFLSALSMNVRIVTVQFKVVIEEKRVLILPLPFIIVLSFVERDEMKGFKFREVLSGVTPVMNTLSN